MKVLYVAPEDSERTGLSAYAQKYYEVLLDYLEDAAIDVKKTNYDSSMDGITSLRKIKDRVSRTKDAPDLIHGEMSSSTFYEFWYVYYLSRKFREATLVLTVHDSPYLCLNPFRGFFSVKMQANFLGKVFRKMFDMSIGSLVERYLVKRSALIFVTTKKGLERFKKRFPESNAEFLPHVSFTSVKCQPDEFIPEGKNIILFQGFILKGKGIEILIRSFSDFLKKYPEQSRLKLVICGKYQHEDTYYIKLKKIVKNLGVADNVQFTGFVEESRLLSFLNNSLCAIFPYYEKKTYSSSGALLRAFSAGCPVIVSDIEMLKEYVIDEYNGLIFRAGDEKDLLLQIEKMGRDRSLRQRVVNNAVRYLKSEHNNEYIAKKTVSKYELFQRAECK